MKISVLTLFPETFSYLNQFSIIGRAIKKKILKLNIVNIREYGLGRYQSVDDRPYGGGVGMIMRVDVIDAALKNINSQVAKGHLRGVHLHSSGGGIGDRDNEEKIILLDPKGKTFNQQIARRFTKLNHLILVCGHYEGVDERVKNFVDETISIGDYILTGGEIPAMVLVDAVCRLLPGVLAKKEATKNESFSNPLILEPPQYTRPATFKGLKVPAILLSGDHQKIDSWRQKLAQKLSQRLLKKVSLA